MKRFLFLALSIPLLSIAIMAQTPSPSIATTPSPSINQAAASPSPSPVPETKGIPNLPWVVEMFASAVMLASVIGVLWLVTRTKTFKGSSIGPRHIQFVSVCLIVPTILILGLEKVLTSETSATLIGGLAGYLLSNLGKYEPPKPPQDPPDPAKGPPKTPGTAGKPDSKPDPKPDPEQAPEPKPASEPESEPVAWLKEGGRKGKSYVIQSEEEINS